ncbi:MAG: molecular chaperone HtpG [Clostridiales bacterium]|nr:molecular chaperone HtpG [Clostridiales bacterium]
MSTERGNLSINSENIFPIIKKWLYSDHDIFFRELISNACDAITKLKKLEAMGELDLPDDNQFKVMVKVNPEEKTITFTDNGIGMTADEVKEYINQIAFSGATKFVEQYKDKANEDQIIGHFGLGFYSAFMVADKVTIDSLSWQPGAKAVHWESESGLEFEMSDSDRAERGTEITLYLNEDSYEFCNEYRAKEIINKYCSFMPVEIYFENANAPVEKKEAEEVADDKKEEAEPKPINNPNPLWTKHPNDCTDEEYKEFYRNVFHDYREPLFWIHLNMDYPFNLKGILYFPKINTEYDSLEGLIKLYNNQVFIADNIKEVIPEFLMLLKGVIDCPDLPLNVSRSALQNDGFVKKISDYISKKVADKLTGMFKVDRENYDKYWDDISPFVKFGCLKDDKFRDRVKDIIIYKNLEGKYITLPEYIQASTKASDIDKEVVDEDKTADVADDKLVDVTDDKDTDKSDADSEDIKDKEDGQKEDKKTIIYYVTDEKQQSQYINIFKEGGLDALILTHNIDQPFITQLEYHDQTIKFQRIDAEISDSFKEDTEKKDEKLLKKNTEAMTKLFRKVLGKDKLEIKVEKLKNEKLSSLITLSEEGRRMQDMMRMYSMPGMDNSLFGDSELLVLNANNKLVQYILNNEKSEHTPMICEQLYDLALLSHRPLEPEAMTKFISRSNEIMLLLTK